VVLKLVLKSTDRISLTQLPILEVGQRKIEGANHYTFTSMPNFLSFRVISSP